MAFLKYWLTNIKRRLSSAKVLRYYVIVDSQPANMARKVNDMIREGWIPQGGVSTHYSPWDHFNYYSQAMVQLGKENKSE